MGTSTSTPLNLNYCSNLMEIVKKEICLIVNMLQNQSNKFQSAFDNLGDNMDHLHINDLIKMLIEALI